MRIRILKWLADISYKYTYVILAVTLISTILAMLVASSVPIRTNWVDMLPNDLPIVKEFNTIIRNFDSDSDIIVVLSGETNAIRQAADHLGSVIEGKPELFKSVYYRLDPDFIRKHGLLLTSEEGLTTLTKVCRDFELVNLLERTNSLLEKGLSESDSAETRALTAQITGGLQSGAEFFQLINTALNGQSEQVVPGIQHFINKTLYGSSYFLSPDQQTLIMFIRPATLDNRKAPAIISLLNNAIRENYPKVKIQLTGLYIISYEELQSIKNDISTATWITTVLEIIVFFLFFRLLLSPFLALVPITAAIFWTMVFVKFTVGSLNLITSIFGVMLIGLGLEYSIHIISNFSDKQYQHLSIPRRARLSMIKSGQGIMTGALTTAMAFFTLMIAKFQGLSELGLVTGMGIVFCFMAVFLIMPALLVWETKTFSKYAWAHSKFYTMFTVDFEFLRKVAKWIIRYRWWFILTITGITIYLFMQAGAVQFDRSREVLQPHDLPSTIALNEVIRKYNMAPDGAMMACNNLTELRAFSASFEKLGTVGFVDSLTNFIPAPEVQGKRLAIITNFHRALGNLSPPQPIGTVEQTKTIQELQHLQANLEELSSLIYFNGQFALSKQAEQLAAGPVQELITNLQKQGDTLVLNNFQQGLHHVLQSELSKVTDVSLIDEDAIPQALRSRYVGYDGKYLLSIFPKQDVWQEPFQSKFLTDIRSVSLRATSSVTMFSTAIDLASKEAVMCTLIAFAVIYLLLLIDFRNILTATITMIPLLFGTVWLVGFMGIWGINYNIINAMAMPLILGIGIDNGVHIMRRYLIEGRGRIPAVLRGTGKAVLLTALTTMIAFGSIAMGHNPGLSSFGLVLFMGVGSCLLSTIIILPACIAIIERFKWSLK